ncbi:putative DENN (AEX-3) domain [Paratrimastix pyriformis]|uniref:DENN (AEX-3) domain n=1 Tax=Paratrimastix pyriformis TaxID=342808 RepID=A0ABQ8UUY3_9EUKA|nr:putative DENN (AEX-3) domain [Paratrimastix pyriformis]
MSLQRLFSSFLATEDGSFNDWQEFNLVTTGMLSSITRNFNTREFTSIASVPSYPSDFICERIGGQKKLRFRAQSESDCHKWTELMKQFLNTASQTTEAPPASSAATSATTTTTLTKMTLADDTPRRRLVEYVLLVGLRAEEPKLTARLPKVKPFAELPLGGTILSRMPAVDHRDIALPPSFEPFVFPFGFKPSPTPQPSSNHSFVMTQVNGTRLHAHVHQSWEAVPRESLVAIWERARRQIEKDNYPWPRRPTASPSSPPTPTHLHLWFSTHGLDAASTPATLYLPRAVVFITQVPCHRTFRAIIDLLFGPPKAPIPATEARPAVPFNEPYIDGGIMSAPDPSLPASFPARICSSSSHGPRGRHLTGHLHLPSGSSPRGGSPSRGSDLAVAAVCPMPHAERLLEEVWVQLGRLTIPAEGQLTIPINDSVVKCHFPPASFQGAAGDRADAQAEAEHSLPFVDVDYDVLFSRLSPVNVARCFECLLMEQHLLVLSDHIELLAPACESLLSLLCPLQWIHVYINLLPNSMADFLMAPMPYLIGAHRSITKMIPIGDDVVLIDLDNNQVRMPNTREFQDLPDRYKLRLYKAVREHANMYYQRHPEIADDTPQQARGAGGAHATLATLELLYSSGDDAGVSPQGYHRRGITAGVSPQGYHRRGITAGVSPQGYHRRGITAGVSPQGYHRKDITRMYGRYHCDADSTSGVLSHEPSGLCGVQPRQQERAPRRKASREKQTAATADGWTSWDKATAQDEDDDEDDDEEEEEDDEEEDEEDEEEGGGGRDAPAPAPSPVRSPPPFRSPRFGALSPRGPASAAAAAAEPISPEAHVLAFRRAFFGVLVSLLQNYARFLNLPPEALGRGSNSPSPAAHPEPGEAPQLFKASEFLAEVRADSVNFLKAFVETQMFSCFIQARLTRLSDDLTDVVIHKKLAQADAKQSALRIQEYRGVLQKEGRNFHTWKTRYFELKGNQLTYSTCTPNQVAQERALIDGTTYREDPTASKITKVKGQVTFREGSAFVELPPTISKHSYPTKFPFQLRTHDRTLVMCAADSKRRREWIKLLKAHTRASTGGVMDRLDPTTTTFQHLKSALDMAQVDAARKLQDMMRKHSDNGSPRPTVSAWPVSGEMSTLTLRDGKMAAPVYLMDDARRTCALNPTSVCKNISADLSTKFALPHPELFAVSLRRGQNEIWADPDHTVEQEGLLTVGPDDRISLKMRYFKFPQPMDPVLMHLMYHQIQQAILSEYWPCPEKVAVELSALQVHATFGDYNPTKHKTGFLNSIPLEKLVPRSLATLIPDSNYWQQRIFSLHARHARMSPDEAKQAYVAKARTLPACCTGLYPATIEQHGARVSVVLAVGEEGLTIFKCSDMTVACNFPYGQIALPEAAPGAPPQALTISMPPLPAPAPAPDPLAGTSVGDEDEDEGLSEDEDGAPVSLVRQRLLRQKRERARKARLDTGGAAAAGPAAPQLCSAHVFGATFALGSADLARDLRRLIGGYMALRADTGFTPPPPRPALPPTRSPLEPIKRALAAHVAPCLGLCAALDRVIEEDKDAVTELALGATGLTNGDLPLLSGAFVRYVVRAVEGPRIPGLVPLQLKSLDVGANRLTMEGVTALEPILRAAPGISRLSLAHILISNTGAIQVICVGGERRGVSGHSHSRSSSRLPRSDRPGADPLVLLAAGDARPGHCDLGNKGLAAILRAVSQECALSTLALPTNRIGDTGAQALAQFIQGGTGLRSVDLSCNRITKAGAAAIAEALKKAPAQQLAALNMSDNPIHEEGLTALFLASKAIPSLKTLGVGWSKASPSRAVVVAHDLGGTQLAHLDLSGHELQSGWELHMLPALGRCPSLRTLSLAACGLGPQDGAALVAALKSLSPLSPAAPTATAATSPAAAAPIGATPAPPPEWLYELNLRGNALAARSVATFGLGALLTSTRLTTLNLSANGLAAHSEALRSLCLALRAPAGVALQALDLSENPLGDEAVMQDLVPSLLMAPPQAALRRLALGQTRLTDLSAPTLSELVMPKGGRAPLQWLDLTSNGFGDPGAVSFIHALQETRAAAAAGAPLPCVLLAGNGAISAHRHALDTLADASMRGVSVPRQCAVRVLTASSLVLLLVFTRVTFWADRLALGEGGGN